MKKLLSLLSATVFMTTGLSTVAACSDNSFKRFSKPTITDKIKNAIIAEITAEGSGKDGDLGNYKFGDIFSNSSNTETLALRLVNQLISEYFYGSTQQQWASWVKYSGLGNQNQFMQIFKNYVLGLATDQLYQDYLDSFSSDTFLEYKMMDSNEDIRINTQTSAENISWALPTVAYVDQNGNPYDASANFQTRAQIKDKLYGENNKPLTPNQLSTLKSQMEYSFHDYLYHVELPKILDQILGQIFLNTDMLSSVPLDPSKPSDNTTFINQYGQLMSEMMNWTNVDINSPDIATNFKMVWEYQVKTGENINKYNEKIAKAQEVNGDLTGAGWTPAKYNTFIANTLDETGSGENNQKGGDPVFGIPHFQGFAAYDNSGNVINGFSTKSSYSDALKSVKVAGFLQSGQGGQYNWNSSSSTGYATYAYVLPIYVPDIMQNLQIGFGNIKDDKVVPGSTKGEVIALKNYNNPAAAPINLNWGGSGLIDENTKSVNYLRELTTSTSPDDQVATLGNVSTKKGIYKLPTESLPLYIKNANDKNQLEENPNVDFTNFNLLRWAQYSFAQDKNTQSLSKTRLYSIAFNYDKKNIYSENLFNDIGQYIEEK